MDKSILSENVNTKSVFKNVNFMYLFIGTFVSQLGDVIYNMAISWYLLSVTKSAIIMSTYMAVGTIIYVIMGPIGGVIADRYNRKILIVMMDICRGFVIALIGILMYFNLYSIWLFYAATVILSICAVIYVPSSNALIPLIVNDENLTKANSLNSSIQAFL